MNTYARSRALESGIIRMTEILPGDSIFCRHNGNNHEYTPSRIIDVKTRFNGRVIRLTHETGAITEHDHMAHARLA